MGTISVLTVAAIAGTDLIIKQYVEKHVKKKEERSVFNGRGILRKVHNKGMMMNRLDKYPHLVRYASLAATGCVLIWEGFLMRKPGHILEKLGTALMAGGAVSNTYDRVKRGYVVDYFSFRTRKKKLTDITFNLGDFAIFGGALLTVLGAVLSSVIPKCRYRC